MPPKCNKWVHPQVDGKVEYHIVSKNLCHHQKYAVVRKAVYIQETSRAHNHIEAQSRGKRRPGIEKGTEKRISRTVHKLLFQFWKMLFAQNELQLLKTSQYIYI